MNMWADNSAMARLKWNRQFSEISSKRALLVMLSAPFHISFIVSWAKGTSPICIYPTHGRSNDIHTYGRKWKGLVSLYTRRLSNRENANARSSFMFCSLMIIWPWFFKAAVKAQPSQKPDFRWHHWRDRCLIFLMCISKPRPNKAIHIKCVMQVSEVMQEHWHMQNLLTYVTVKCEEFIELYSLHMVFLCV